eukprot:GHRQ01012796.1.p1 GENE.GHRQ01012796.1~~GHRQ01012796.1.p1  ORF type:complete len:323 (+),score=78.69 GHRQ01012796.1:384-1352(+)
MAAKVRATHSMPWVQCTAMPVLCRRWYGSAHFISHVGALLHVCSAQRPPWEASDMQLAAHQLLVDTGAWPAAVAVHVSGQAILALPSNGQLSLDSLLLLKPDEWLDDELVNYAMWWLQQRDRHMFSTPSQQLLGVWTGVMGASCHFFNSFFMSKLYLDAGTVNYDKVRRWTAASKLRMAGQAKHEQGVLSCSLLVAPCNLGNTHWTLVVADLDRCRILYLDPLGGRRTDVADAMAAWVRAEAFDKRQQWWDTDSWPRVHLRPGKDIPRQADGHSCALYAAVLADCLGAGVPLQHCRMAAADATAVRARMLDNICTGVTRFAG